MSFIRFWIGATVIGLAITALVLYWALNRKMFSESDRAAHLPLAGLKEAPPRARASKDAVVLLGILGVGLGTFVVVVVIAMTTP